MSTTEAYVKKRFPLNRLVPKIAMVSFAIGLSACGSESGGPTQSNDLSQPDSINGLWSATWREGVRSDTYMITELSESSVLLETCDPTWNEIWERDGNQLSLYDDGEVGAVLTIAEDNRSMDGEGYFDDDSSPIVLVRDGTEDGFNSGSFSLTVDGLSLFDADGGVCANYDENLAEDKADTDFYYLGVSAPYEEGRVLLEFESDVPLLEGEYNIGNVDLDVDVFFYDGEGQETEEHRVESGTVSLTSVSDGHLEGKFSFLSADGLEISGEFTVIP